MTIGQKIHFARQKEKMTQEQLAAFVGCGRLHICKLENDVEYPSLYTLKVIADRLGMKQISEALYTILG